MPNENNLLPEHAQLAAVLDNPDAIQRIKEPTEKVQIAAVQKKMSWRAAMRAASLQTLAISAPEKPGVWRASRSTSTF